ncbi:MAG TPA: dicarboxylate/amino acid:cation symporter [Methylomirabilota bacterium]|nr:dicarboxylate/amino acid:cation symporter [Methylomirabilota bacterium]
MSAEHAHRLANRILLGLGVGVTLGALTLALGNRNPELLAHTRAFSTAVLDPLGRVFLHLLFFVVVPLIFASLALGIVQLGSLDRLGPLAVRTAVLFTFNMAIGVGIGLVAMGVVRPGDTLAPEIKAQLLAEHGGGAARILDARSSEAAITFSMLVDMFFPRNLARAVVDFQVLPLITFALLVGVAGTQLKDSQRRKLQEGLEMVTTLMTHLVHYALQLAPLAVPAMIFSVVVRLGHDVLVALAAFAAVCLGAMAIHLFGTMSLCLRLLTRRRPLQFFRDIRTVLVTAFSTSSSNATLPTSMQVGREQLGLSPGTVGFVLPLGATMNMSGTALYEGCVVLFVAQVYGVPLGVGSQVTLLVLAVLSAVAVAGIPGASLPLIAGLLTTFQVPAEGIALVLGLDRLLDMARTALNVGADLVVAAVVDERVVAEAAGASPPADSSSG